MFLLGKTYTLSGLVLESAYPERNPALAKQVCTKLLMRMSSDLRAIIMLAEVGYDVQANALAAPFMNAHLRLEPSATRAIWQRSGLSTLIQQRALETPKV